MYDVREKMVACHTGHWEIIEETFYFGNSKILNGFLKITYTYAGNRQVFHDSQLTWLIRK